MGGMFVSACLCDCDCFVCFAMHGFLRDTPLNESNTMQTDKIKT